MASLRSQNHRNTLKVFIQNYSIEVMPRTAAKIRNFQTLLPLNTRVYIAHIHGTPIEKMVACAQRIAQQGYAVMPHFPARIIKDKNTLQDWIARYQGEADVKQALVLAGGINKPLGDYHSSMQLLDSDLFDANGFTHLHLAGHPEGNRDIDPNGQHKNLMAALAWKQAFAKRSDAEIALVTQFCFDAAPMIAWVDSLARSGIDLPVHIGIAGPARLQTMIKFAIECGVGPSLRILRHRAKDIRKLLLPFEPIKVLSDLANHKMKHPNFNINKVHFFPLGGIKKTATWVQKINA